ncbi:c-type cytochrome [Marivivens donghaensis]|uniref:C-type cytochrome n=1 Tax=Marivivens donghaensis TaxID=1699413 RepID=A0ABX0VT48_9RHOB|nr:c-type cytochrome [Marivivens donghaensis]NIY71075.1 c-type cytochrome [Marivivens donghaensis]
MSKFLKIFVPALGGATGILAISYMMADQLVVDIPAPVREAIAVRAAYAEEVKAQAAADAEAAAALAAQMEAAGHAPSIEGGYGLGRPALTEEVAAWNTDIRPDGMGLPEGSGDVWTGEEVFVEKCAMCHGDFGEAVGRWPVLAGGQGTLENEDPVKTIGSYWPYLSTVYDYVNRAMPFGDASTLTPDEVYAITAYLLYLNNEVEDDFTLSSDNFTEVRLPNEENFFMDDRMDTEFPVFIRADICMENCKDEVEITMHASVLDVTPEEEGASEEDALNEEAATTTEESTTEVAAQETTEEAPAEEPAVEMAAFDPELAAAGERVFGKCRACHKVGDGARNGTGPQLNGIVGRGIGALEDFRYSDVFQEAHANGETWDEERLGAFLANPRDAMPRTRMSFAGLRDQGDIDAVIDYLKSVDQ